ncbi:Allene oxide synthase protein [Thalictrum thalictroides]|uniref:Allene oxide synthase protein n=1 Tax=Thalictrum thalictroides TaxID=46969 RepID=A0A7J6X8D8_THATH|nr:Allene oxide synthase protein [Thalictrum thalictroides]
MLSSSSPSPTSTPTIKPSSPPPSTSLPVRAIPGSYGLPLIGAVSDRLNYYWFQGPETFLKKKMESHKSTVFRTNIPPSFPFFLNVNPKMIAVLDCKAFSTLFDMDVVEKKNVLIGDFMPSTSFTGNIRVGVYLDTTEPQHAQVKSFCLDILKRSSNVWTSEFLSNINDMWGKIEKDVAVNGSASYLIPLQQSLFRFLAKCIVGADPATSPEVAENGHIMLDKWLALQLIPTQSIPVLQPLVEIFLHSFAYPFALVSGDYGKLYKFVKIQGNETVQRGITEYGLKQDEAIHNLIFVLGFNAFGGFSVFLPSLLDSLGSNNEIQEKLRMEVREVVGSSPLSFELVKKLDLVQSFVYETLRFKPPVRAQFARARKDFVLGSHDSGFEVKKGELLFGYQPFAMRDPKVFDDPETFIPDRFIEDKGKELLKYLYWSNGPQSDSPSTSNKQCAAKDYVVLTACMLVADMFQRYDSITATSSAITAIEKAK